MDAASDAAIASAVVSAIGAGIAIWQTRVAKNQAGIAHDSADAAKRQAAAAEEQVRIMLAQLQADEAARLEQRRPRFDVPAGFVSWEDSNFPRGRLAIRQTGGDALRDVTVRATGQCVRGLRGGSTDGLERYETVASLELGPMSIGTETEVYIDIDWEHFPPLRVELELTGTAREGDRNWTDHVVTALNAEPQKVKDAREKKERRW